MALGINAARPHTSTSRCCSQFIYSVHIYGVPALVQVDAVHNFSILCTSMVFLH
jgi:hypothetical protein